MKLETHSKRFEIDNSGSFMIDKMHPKIDLEEILAPVHLRRCSTQSK